MTAQLTTKADVTFRTAPDGAFGGGECDGYG